VNYSDLVMPKLFGTFGSHHDFAPLENGFWEHDTEQKKDCQQTVDGTIWGGAGGLTRFDVR
jgi:hypothetical protein